MKPSEACQKLVGTPVKEGERVVGKVTKAWVEDGNIYGEIQLLDQKIVVGSYGEIQMSGQKIVGRLTSGLKTKKVEL